LKSLFFLAMRALLGGLLAGWTVRKLARRHMDARRALWLAIGAFLTLALGWYVTTFIAGVGAIGAIIVYLAARAWVSGRQALYGAIATYLGFTICVGGMQLASATVGEPLRDDVDARSFPATRTAPVVGCPSRPGCSPASTCRCLRRRPARSAHPFSTTRSRPRSACTSMPSAVQIRGRPLAAAVSVIRLSRSSAYSKGRRPAAAS
jgi:hypothetical protein